VLIRLLLLALLLLLLLLLLLPALLLSGLALSKALIFIFLTLCPRSICRQCCICTSDQRLCHSPPFNPLHSLLAHSHINTTISQSFCASRRSG
jgi:hypothetical protein